MSAPKCNEYDYINFLVAARQQYSCLEASRVQPCPEDAPSHDSLTRLLHRLEPSPQRLWSEVAGLVDPGKGALVIDDPLPDKPHSRKIELVTRHWSGKHRRSVPGIPLVSLVWTGGDRQLPTDYRVHAKGHDGLDKHQLCRQMPGKAKEARLQSRMRPVRLVVRQPRDPQAAPEPEVALDDAAEEEPAGQPRRLRQHPPGGGRLSRRCARGA